MRVLFCDQFTIPLPEGHRFPMEKYALLRERGVAVNLSGGTHHAFPDRGEGFCVFNDVAVAARVMQTEDWALRAVILDLDVHQGNGTAFIFRNAPEVFTLSVHGANN